MIKNIEAIKLFFSKEWKELIGKKRRNLIMLFLIFIIAIISIGFGSAGLSYLSYKMEDPFINWVDIIVNQSVGSGKESIKTYLENTNNQNVFQFKNPEDNYVLSNYFRHSQNQKDIQLEGRSIATQSSIMQKIIEPDNIVNQCLRSQNIFPISNNDLGIIITQESLHKLGYNEIPSLINLSLPYDINECINVGLDGGYNGYYPISIPIIAVVKQLPGMYDFVFTMRFRNEIYSRRTTLDITSIDNNNCLSFVGEENELQQVKTYIENKYTDLRIEEKIYNNAWNELYSLEISSEDHSTDKVVLYNEINNDVASLSNNINRVYNFYINDYYFENNPAYYSIQMASLDSIRSFKDDLYDKCGIKLEMTNIEAKENFRFVQRMGNILSWIIIIMSILFICMFIHFLLNSHFQKIQRNLGTFKAFGIRNQTLYYVYLGILLLMTISTFIGAFVIAACFSYILSLITTIEVSYNWIDVWTWQNLILIAAAIIASMTTTLFVASRRLKHTPGNLIYNRI